MHLEPALPAVALDSTANSADRAVKQLRAALVIQLDRALIFALSAIAVMIGQWVGIIEIHWRAGLTVLVMALASTLLFSRLARRSFARQERADLAAWWIACDVAVITAMVPVTGGLSSPCWIWYLACGGTSVMHRGRRFAVSGAAVTAVLYLGVLVWDGSIRGFDETLLLACSRLVFLGCASFALLHNTLRLRESKQVVRRLKDEAEMWATELHSANHQLEAMSQLLRDQSLTDPLTGLRNRRYLAERIADVAARRGGRPVHERRVGSEGLGSGFLALDLDRFKPINDTHGHAAGDAALQHVANVLRDCTRADDTVARLGGDEFMVFLPHVDADGLRVVAEKVAAAMRTQPARLSPTASMVLSFSIGCALVDPSDESAGTDAFDNAMAAADWALYEAKQEGRNCIRGIAGSPRASELAIAGMPAQRLVN